MGDNSPPRVSVVIPNYNHGRFLSDAIQSVLDQTFDGAEVIVVDDGSTDKSPAVAAGFGSQIRYIRQENQGLSAARNTGLREARGAYIGVLDADDMYAPAFLATLVPMLEADPEAAAVYCGYQFMDAEGHPLPRIERRVVPCDRFYQTLAMGNFLVPESILVRRRCYEEVGFFDEMLRACEDWDVWLRIAGRFRIVGTDQVLTRHRVLPGSMSSDPDRMLRNRLAVLEKHFGNHQESSKEWSALKRRAYGGAFLNSAVEYLQREYSNENAEAYTCLVRVAQSDRELLTKMSSYYELACAQQSPGVRGNLTALDCGRSREVVCNLVARLFADEQTHGILDDIRTVVWASVHHGLGEIAYGAGDYTWSRYHLLRALKLQPGYEASWRLLVLYLKSLYHSLSSGGYGSSAGG